MSRPTRSASPPPLVSFGHRNMPLLLLQARECVLARFRPLLNAHGLTEQQWRILRLLMETGPLEPRQIGRRCGISSPSLAGILARMEALALVARERLAHDQRRQRVTPTEAGRTLARRLAPHIDAEYAAIEAQLGPALVASLYAVVDHVIDRLGPGAQAQDDPA